MQPETAKRLRDALDAAIETRDVASTPGIRSPDLLRMQQLAIERLLAIVGEALNHAMQPDDSLERSIPDARKIIGMRNRIIHGYDQVQDEIIWDSARNHIPNLIDQLQTLIDTAPDPDA